MMGRGNDTSVPAQPAPESRVGGMLAERREWLVDRSIEIAKLNGYAPYTTTIRAAWVEAIQSVSEALCAYLAAGDDGVFGPRAGVDYRRDARFARMRQIARQHRSLGITLPMYTGLLKHFRNIYLGVFEATGAGPGVSARVCDRVRDFFDETELAVVADWTEAGNRGRLRELQERTRALTLEKDRYFATFESIRDPAFLLDRNHRVLNANQAAAELFLGDARAGDIIYLRSMRRRKADLQQKIDTILAGMDRAGQTCWLEAGSGTRCYDIRMRALHDAVENMAIGHVVVLHDVTAHLRAVEEAQRAKRQMSRFLATMSHEIRTPLHSVLGAADLLRSSEGEDREKFLDVIESAGQSLLQTLSNVLDYSKLENSRPVPRPVATNLSRALSAFRRVAEAGSRNAGMGVRVDLDPGLPETIRIDWTMVCQVLSNLVSNAIRHDDGRGVSVSVRQARADGGEPRIRFEVRDHGPGLPGGAADALFQPFAEAVAHDTGHDGAGLGLAICRHLVEAMGGEIGCVAAPGATVFGFTVPYARVGRDDRPDRPVIAKRGSREPVRRCLLVDDDPAGAMITRHQIAEFGFEVTTAGDVAGAFAAARQASFDLFVVDYLLPDGDGPSLVRALRGDHAGATFIALTANVEAIRDSDVSVGLFDRLLAKPIDMATLGEALCALDPAGAGGAPAAAADTILCGLSRDTVLAMTDAFDAQWRAFRDMVGTADPEAERAQIGYAAHRLAGSCAIIGLTELEGPLRGLEEACLPGNGAARIRNSMDQITFDLDLLPSWQRILELGGRK